MRPHQEFRMGKGTFPNLKEKSFKGAFQIISGIQLLLCLISCKWITATRINLSSGRKTNYKRLHTGFLLRWRGGSTKRRRRKDTMLAGPVLAETGLLCPPPFEMDMASGQSTHLDKWSVVWISAVPPSFAACLVKCALYTAVHSSSGCCFSSLSVSFGEPKHLKKKKKTTTRVGGQLRGVGNKTAFVLVSSLGEWGGKKKEIAIQRASFPGPAMKD